MNPILCFGKMNEYIWSIVWRMEVIAMRVQVILECTETGDRNYITTKNKKNNPERLELMKYSPRLKRHTLHRETK